MPALSRDLILRTAVALADAEGLDAATLRQIASRLGVHVTSLYHHVPTKDAVVDGVVEHLLEAADLPLEPVGWEQWVRRFFAALGDIASRHPGAFAALERRPVQGPRATATFEVALTAFTHAGLSTQDAYGAVKATVLLALGAGAERALQSAGSSAETVLEALPAEQFPQVRALATSSDPAAAWEFSLETLVSGLRSQVRRRR